MAEMYDWYRLVVNPTLSEDVTSSRRARGGRKVITMEQMTAGVFCDLVVEVSKTSPYRGHFPGPNPVPLLK